MTIAYVALGSNTSNSIAILTKAIKEINLLATTNVLATSKFYWTSFVGSDNQPDVLNGIAEITTDLSAENLLHELLAIEQRHGRIRDKNVLTARTLDLDLLLFGSDIIDLPTLTVPHPRLKQRNFVLYPLADVAPELVLPCGTSLISLLEQTSWDGREENLMTIS